MSKYLILFITMVCSLSVFAERNLKMRVSVGNVESRSFPVPGGGEFDFGFALNSQLMVEMGRSDDFFASYRASDSNPISISSADNVSMVMAPTDMYGNQVPQCLLDRKYVRLEGAVTSFELEGGSSIKVGYSKGDPYSGGWGASAKFSVEKSRLYLNMYAIHTPDMMNSFPYAASEGEHTAKYRKTELDINFKGFSVSPSFFHTSKLAAVTKKAAKKALGNINDQLRDMQNDGTYEWQTTVISKSDPVIEIRAGSMDGVKVGDRFMVKNMRHEWDGEPCKSRYRGYNVGEAAIIEVFSTEHLTSRTKPVEYYNNIYVGDRVVIEKLID